MGARPQEIAAAQVAVDAAQAQVARLKQDPRTEDIAGAQAALAGAMADQKKALEGADPQQLIAAAAELANAEAAVRQAQSAYNSIKGNPDAARYPQALTLEQATNALTAAQARYAELKKAARRQPWPRPTQACSRPRPNSTG